MTRLAQMSRIACWGAASLTAAVLCARPSPARACGGLFCSTANPVNQAAEQIVFAKNDDGTITAAIQIQYEGPAHEFAWVLPVPGTPEVGIASDAMLQNVKQLTNPQYMLSTQLNGCANLVTGASLPPGAVTGGSGGSGGAGGAAGSAGVSVLSSGAIGPYLYDTIAVDPELDDPVQVALDWLSEHAYDVGRLGPDVLRPYLAEGLNLLAFKLEKDADAGSIRPVLITYRADKPSIPIRPTAVAANEDMGVLVFLLSDVRAVPENYKAIELNEALIDWFNPEARYGDLVSRAAAETMGQGFVTEYAGRQPWFGSLLGSSQLEKWNSFVDAREPEADPIARYSEAFQS